MSFTHVQKTYVTNTHIHVFHTCTMYQRMAMLSSSTTLNLLKKKKIKIDKSETFNWYFRHELLTFKILRNKHGRALMVEMTVCVLLLPDVTTNPEWPHIFCLIYFIFLSFRICLNESEFDDERLLHLVYAGLVWNRWQTDDVLVARKLAQLNIQNIS